MRDFHSSSALVVDPLSALKCSPCRHGVGWPGIQRAAMLAPGVFPLGSRRPWGRAGLFQAAAVITVLVLLGQVLDCARVSDLRRIRPCSTLRQDRATRGDDGPMRRVTLDLIHVADGCASAGEKVPVDGN